MVGSSLYGNDSSCTMVIASLRSRWSFVGQHRSVGEGHQVGVLEVEGLSARLQELGCRRILARRSVVYLHRAQENCPGPRLCGGRSLRLDHSRGKTCNRETTS